MLLVIFLTGAILWNLPWSKYDYTLLVSAVEPGYLDFDNLPDTNFSCDGKVIGGYYADIETGCQMFHVCTIGQKSEITDIKFLCLNGTVFDQETRVCERLDEVDCSKSESFFDLNLELYGNNGGGYGIQPEDEGKVSEDEQSCDEEYEDDENACKQKFRKDSKKDEEYADWNKSTTSAVPLSRIFSTTSATTTVKLPVSTTTRPVGSVQSKFHYQPSKEIPVQLTTPDTGLQLLALHESFQENLKNRDAVTKSRPNAVIPAKNITLFNYSKLPPAYSSFQVVNSPQVKATTFVPLPNKLPNIVSNLSQKSHFPNTLSSANRTPSPLNSHSVTTKPETQFNFHNKQHSQKVTNKSTLLPTPGMPKHQNINTPPVLYAYKILETDGTRADNFSPNVHYNLQSSPSPTIMPTFKMETVRVSQLAHPTFTIAQNRPYNLHPKPSHFVSAKEEVEEDLEEIEEAEEEGEEVLPERQQPLHQNFDDHSHSNFARAIAERASKNTSDAAVSVVLSSSSVSSSISSKPQSAISNSSAPTSSLNVPVRTPFISKNSENENSFSSTLLDTSTQFSVDQPNLTEINEQLTEEQPYYEEASIDYDENSQEYKDLLYPADVQKIKQR